MFPVSLAPCGYSVHATSFLRPYMYTVSREKRLDARGPGVRRGAERDWRRCSDVRMRDSALEVTRNSVCSGVHVRSEMPGQRPGARTEDGECVAVACRPRGAAEKRNAGASFKAAEPIKYTTCLSCDLQQRRFIIR